MMLIRCQNKSEIVSAIDVWLSERADDDGWEISAYTSNEDSSSISLGKYLTREAAQAALDEIWENARQGKATDLSRAVENNRQKHKRRV